MTGLADPLGHSSEMQRDSEGNLLHVTSPAGNRIDFRYDGQSRVVETHDSHGRSVQYAYDGAGRLVHVQDSRGQVENYAYNDRNDMTEIDDALHRPLLVNEYDATDWVVRQRLPDGRTFTYAYQRASRGGFGARRIRRS
ncbi:MAG TPA: hypothetical protein VGS20_05785 [Candidatus Acidoferrales bacterium]|nr:hypothetical protein [Candidatus Acidoferrales bacterium]